MAISTKARWTCAWVATVIFSSGCSNDAAPADDVGFGATARAQAQTRGPDEAGRHVTDPLQEYRQQCSAGGQWTLDCEYLRGLLAARTVLKFCTCAASTASFDEKATWASLAERGDATATHARNASHGQPRCDKHRQAEGRG